VQNTSNHQRRSLGTERVGNVTDQQIVVLLSVIEDYADQAQTATRNITALLQSL
jgi:hypothetical protein